MAQETITTYPSSYDSVNYKYASVNSSYPLSNPVGKGSSNTTYAQWNLTTGSSAETYVFYIFDLSTIPNDATIDSVSCTAKTYISSTNSSRINTRQIQLYYGTGTAKGSASTVSTSTSALTLTCGSWNREELNDCRIRIYTKRGTSSTTTTYYNRFYGATLTVTYTYNDITYTITSSASTGGSISPSGSTTVSEGDNLSFTMVPYDGYELSYLKVNNVDVEFTQETSTSVESGLCLLNFNGDINDALSLATINNQGCSINNNTIKFGNGSLYLDGSSYLEIVLGQTMDYFTLELWFYCTSVNTSNRYPTVFSTETNNSSGGTYVHVDDGSYSTYPVYRCNNTSSGNSGAYGSTIISRDTWHHLAYCKNGNTHYYFLDGVLQATLTQSSPNSLETIYIGGMYNGSSMTSTCYFEGYIDDILLSSICKYTSNFDIPSEYSNESKIHYIYTLENITTDTDVYAYFITVSGEQLMLKTNGVWSQVSKVYKKVNGSWIEQTDLAILFDSNINYVKA